MLRHKKKCKNVLNFAVNGNWGAWTQWTTCSSSCGGGSRKRTRRCDNPPPSSGGGHCPGDSQQIDYCNKEECPGPCTRPPCLSFFLFIFFFFFWSIIFMFVRDRLKGEHHQSFQIVEVRRKFEFVIQYHSLEALFWLFLQCMVTGRNGVTGETVQ